MPASDDRLIGINEVGHVDGGTDTSWGNTQQDGVSLQFSTSTAELMSGQAKMLEQVELVEAGMSLVIALVTSNLQILQRALGIPASDFTGDLAAATPTDEVLTITEGNLGTVERQLYALAPGPSGARRIEAIRCRVSDIGDLNFAADAYVLPEVTWQVLNPATADPLTITDQV